MNRLTDPFEPTPERFHQRMEQTLKELSQTKTHPAPPPRRTARRLAFALGLTAALLTGLALALESLGVFHFFTQRYHQPIDAGRIQQPAAQSCTSQLIAATLEDAYWDGETLSFTLSVRPKNPAAALYMETDVGADGESFDQIWWKGDILPFDQWRAGRETIRLMLPRVTASVPCTLTSWDWVQDGQGETLLIELAAEDMTKGATLDITLESRVLDTELREAAALTAVLPPMEKGETSK